MIKTIILATMLNGNAYAGEVGVLFSGFTTHLTTKYAKQGGYNWNNRIRGLEYLSNSCKFGYGGSIAIGRESFNKPMKLAMVTGEYNWCYDKYTVGMGGGIGYTETSYYEGAVPAIYGKIKHNKTGLYSKLTTPAVKTSKTDLPVTIVFGVSVKF